MCRGHSHPIDRARRRARVVLLLVGCLSASLVGCDETDLPAAVAARTVARVVIREAGLPMEVGDTANLSAQAYDAAGDLVSDPLLSWRSDDPGVATVDPNGRVIAVNEGGAQVFAESGSAADSITVSVFPSTTPRGLGPSEGAP